MSRTKSKENTVNSFFSKVSFDAECWQWMASSSGGYGRFYDAMDSFTKQAHRYSYEVMVGDIPEGYQIDHLCMNRGCVNPDHLEAVTHQENLRRSMMNMGMSSCYKTHCKNGHEYTPENTKHHKRLDIPRGYARDCRTCKRLSDAQYKIRRKANVKTT